jgi:activating signal cointegrator complex subunit 3
LNNYLSLLGHQAPIESGFIKALVDHMNAEVVNGTITNIKEAALWLSYTFLFVRMGKNPVAYGMSFEEKFEDPQLDRKREQLVRDAAETLDKCMMVRFDKRSGNLAVTDLGRVASYYYIKCGTIEAFNAMLTPHLSDSEALHVLCSAAEFDQLKLRPEELPEIDSLLKEAVVAVKGPVEETPGKVNVLLQAYCNQTRINSFTLMSDTNYVAQNAGRICRALFETCLKRGWCNMARYYLTLSKCIDRRMRPDQTPLRQFHLDELPRDVTRRIEETHIDINQMLDMTSKEVGTICHNQKLGSKILSLIQMLPHLDVHAVVRPITRGILRMTLTLSAAFKWQDKYHGACESFWVWVEDGESEAIYHTEHFLLSKKTWQEDHLLELTLPIREPLPPQYYVRTMSDRWVGCESTITVSFQHLILPDQKPPHTNLLDIHPVPRTALQNPTFESLYRFSHFNPIQSQTFHTLYHTDANVLVGAPTGSGKTIIGEIAMLRLLHTRPGAKIVYVAPLKALARERLTDWKKKLGDGLGLSVLELTGEVTPDLALLKRADVLVVTPEKWDGISRGWAKREYVQRVELMIIDEIHLLGVDRGPVLEVIVSRMRFISAQTSNPIRFVGLSTALANPRDLADWLGIGSIGLYNFRPSVRPIPMTIHIQGFAGKHYCPRMATMNKPTYAAILEHSPVKPALVFVSSRRQTRLTALDLISYCASDDNPKKFLKMPEEDIIAIASTLKDSALRDTIVFGIGIHHAGLDNHDRNTVEELFTAAKIQVLVCTSTLAWGVNL